MPLSDIVVIELASVLAGPSAGQYLAELGASVLKIENARTDGDVTRTWRIASEYVDTDQTAYFSCCNWGKQSVAIDLSDPRGQEIVYGLVRKADVVLDSYKPGAAKRLGVDADKLCSLNEGLIHVAITGYGNGDPRAGYDAAIQAESGFMSINGYPDGPPTKMPVALIDVLAGHQVKEAVLVGLIQRAASGTGYRAAISLFESAIASLVNQASGLLQAGIEPGRRGSDHPSIVPYGTPYQTRDDRWLTLAVGTDRQFEHLVEVLGLDDELSSDRFASNADRVKNRAEVEEAIAKAIRARDFEDLIVSMESASIPSSKVATIREALSSPLSQRMILADGSGSARLAGVRQSAGSDHRALPRPPHFGEHSISVLRDLLRYDGTTIKTLIDSGVVYQSDLS